MESLGKIAFKYIWFPQKSDLELYSSMKIREDVYLLPEFPKISQQLILTESKALESRLTEQVIKG